MSPLLLIPRYLLTSWAVRRSARHSSTCAPPDQEGGCLTCAACDFIGPPDEYICDGGDDGLPVGVRADWRVDGLEQEDTVAHYDTLDGRVVVQPSNRVCIYAPRFAAVRRAMNHETRQAMREGHISGKS